MTNPDCEFASVGLSCPIQMEPDEHNSGRWWKFCDRCAGRVAAMAVAEDSTVAPPASDDDIVMRFRQLFADTLAVMPAEHFKDDIERKSTVVTMMLRATLQELVAHIGPGVKRLSFVLDQELGRAVEESTRRIVSH